MDYSAITLDSFAGSFWSTGRDGVLESAGRWGYLESRDSSDLMNHLDVARVHPEQIYQCALLMECRRDAFDFAGMTNSRLNTISRTQMGEQQYLYHDEVVGLPQQSQSQSHLEEHIFSGYDYSSSLRNPPSLLIPNLDCTTKQAAAAGAAHLPSVGTDEAAIMRAMMAVISSSNSPSSAASSPSAISKQPPHEALTPPTTHQTPAANSTSPPPPLSRAFRPYSSTTPDLERRETSTRCGGQKMIKESVEMLRRMRSRKGDESSSRSTNNNNQLHHMISERRRREKLNDSFHRLRMILPPRSKKDKSSVLIDARNHLKTLRTQIAELEEKNRRLETHLLADEAGEEGSVRVQVMKAASSEAAACGVLQQIHIMITVREECDIVDLLLNVLECLKGLRVVSIGAVDAFTYAPQMPAFARASLKLQIRSCDWDEVLLQEAVKKAIDDVTAIPESIYFQFD